MTIIPTFAEQLARARSDLRVGLPVRLTSREGDVLATPAEGIKDDRLAALRALGTPVLAITGWRARTLKAPVYDGDISRLQVPLDATPAWISCMADPADDLSMPMKGPFISLREGSPATYRTALLLVKSAQLLPAAVVVAISKEKATPHLTHLDADRTMEMMTETSPMDDIVSGRVPTGLAGQTRVHVFRPEDGGEEHYVVEIGDRSEAPLVRLHSACFTGDVLGSLKCDCGPQLHAALAAMKDGGILLYLNQEGRGIGLANKLRAYSLQDQGFDTVEANHRLGFEDDERDFRIGALLLNSMNVSRVRLLTNNPRKVAMLEQSGIEVADRVPLTVGRRAENAAYLDTKAKKSGHLL